MTSSRLGAEAQVANRLFPKTRSWFALGSPLELLSPLSVVRLLFAEAVVTWPLLILGLRLSDGDAAVLASVIAAMAAVWVATMRVREMSIRTSQMLTAAAAVAATVAIAAGHGSPLAIAFLPFLMSTGVVAGLFLGVRALLAHVLVASCALWIAFESSQGLFRATISTLAVGLGLTIVALTVQFLTSSTRRHSTVDAETGLLNGLGLAELVHRKVGEYSTFIVAVTRLAGLGEARDALGYQVGAELLRRAVEDLGQVVPRTAAIGRVEGDQLVVILPLPPGRADSPANLVAATDAAREMATTLIRAIGAGRYLVDGIEVSLRGHVGLALAPWDGDEVTELVRRASLSAREAEIAGQTQRLWDGAHGAMTADDLAVLADLRLAGDRGELWLAYQPQVASSSGRPVSVEALIRWNHATRGAVTPSTFIPLAERTGLVTRITEWVLAEALDAQVRWRADGIHVPVSVNLSAKTLTRPDLAEWVLAELTARNLPPSSLTLEVTETAETADLVEAVNLLRPLRQQGIRVSLDDFGTGYTSLAALPHLPLDELKVDQGFVLRSATSPADEAIVRSVRDLARRLGLESVAEGVEDAETAQRMTDYGFELLQGYYLARPLTETGLLEYLAVAGAKAPARDPIAAEKEAGSHR